MQLRLTWKIKSSGRNLDLLVSDDQKIKDTIQVLVEKDLIAEDALHTVKYVRSLRTNNQVNVLLTYQEGRIYSGDILELEDSES